MHSTAFVALAAACLTLAAAPAAASDPTDLIGVGTILLECDDSSYDSDSDGSAEDWTRCHGPPCLAVMGPGVGASVSVTALGQDTFASAGTNFGCYGFGYAQEGEADDPTAPVGAEVDPRVWLPETGPGNSLCSALADPPALVC